MIGKPEQDSLKHNIMLKTEYSFYNKITPWIKGEWQIDRYMGDTNINREYYKDIFLASMGVRYDINKQWNINAAIYNLLTKVLQMVGNLIKIAVLLLGSILTIA